eukprot:scaffold73313_cov27-Tisochrysis_lutea.AAC.1
MGVEDCGLGTVATCAWSDVSSDWAGGSSWCHEDCPETNQTFEYTEALRKPPNPELPMSPRNCPRVARLWLSSLPVTSLGESAPEAGASRRLAQVQGSLGPARH